MTFLPAPVARPSRTAAVTVAAVAVLFASLALLARVTGPGPRGRESPTPDGSDRPGAAVAGPVDHGPRFTLRLGQGFRFRDGAVVGNPDDRPDLTFRYVPPQVGGMSTRYNPVSQQVEVGLEPTLTAAMPLLVSTHIQAFETRPDVARTTSGDIAAYGHQVPVTTGTRYVLLMNGAGDQHLLRLDLLEAPAGRYDDWRIGFTYERVELPVGLPGGKILQPLPGRLVYRDWYRTKRIVSIDLATGSEEAIADGVLPSALEDRLLGFADTSGAYVVRDAAGQVRSTTRFDEQVLGPVLSPDGTRLAGTVYRPGPAVRYGESVLPGAPVLSVGVFDLQGREVSAFPGYDDAAWTPDGRLVATGKLTDAGLFEIDLGTKEVRPIHAGVDSPSQPCVSPDGRTVAFISGGRVWLIERDGKDLRQLLQDGHTQQRPAFSPDGTKIALVICNTMAADMTGEVFVVDLATREPAPIRTRAGLSAVPDPSTRLSWIR